MRVILNGVWIVLVVVVIAACGGSDKDDSDADTPVDCASLDETTCASTVECGPIQAERICLQTGAGSEFVGCQTADIGCDEAITSAGPSGVDGECWTFTNRCIPQGWVAGCVCEPTDTQTTMSADY